MRNEMIEFDTSCDWCGVDFQRGSRVNKALAELHLRREVERLLDKLPKGKIKSANYRYTKGKGNKGKYVISLRTKDKYGETEYLNYPCKSLTELHAKLVELGEGNG